MDWLGSSFAAAFWVPLYACILLNQGFIWPGSSKVASLTSLATGQLAVIWSTLVLLQLPFPLYSLEGDPRAAFQEGKLQGVGSMIWWLHSFISATFFWSKEITGQSRFTGLGDRFHLLVGGAAKYLWPYWVCYMLLLIVNPALVLSDLIKPLK